MPVNIGITFLVGGTFGWVAVKVVRPEPYLQDLIIAMCSTGIYIYMYTSVVNSNHIYII